MFYCTKCQRVSVDGAIWTVEKEQKKNQVYIGILCEFCKLRSKLDIWNWKYWMGRG